MGAALLLSNALYEGISKRPQVGIAKQNSFRGQGCSGWLQRSAGRYASVEHVETAWSIACQRTADFDRSVSRGLQAQRDRAGIFQKSRIKVIGHGGSDHYFGSFEYSLLEILGQDPVILQFEMWTMFLRSRTERDHYHRRWSEELLCLQPGKIC